MAVGITGVSSAIQGAATVMREFDATNRNLVVGTGARGSGLRDLFDITGEVASRVGIGLEQVSSIVAELDTTFPELRQESKGTFAAIAEDVAQLEFVFQDIDANQALNAFRGFTDDIVESREAFDLLASLGTTTPGGLGPVIQFLDRYGAALETVGLNLNESLFLLSSLRRENINLRRFGSGLGILRTRAAEEGVDPRQRLEEVVSLIDMATTAQEKNNIAVEYFGQDASSQWLSAIDAGVLALEGLDEALIASEGALDDLEARTTTATSLMGQAWSAFSSRAGESIQSVVSSAQESGVDLDRVAGVGGRAAFDTTPIGGLLALGGIINRAVRGERVEIGDVGRAAGAFAGLGSLVAGGTSIAVEVNADTIIGSEDVEEVVTRAADRAVSRVGIAGRSQR